MKRQEDDFFLEKIHLLITLLATLVTTVVCIIFPVPIMDLCIRLICTITAFYIIGRIVKKHLMKIFDEKNAIELEKQKAEKEAAAEAEAEAGNIG